MRMRTQGRYFEPVSLRSTKSGRCAGCGLVTVRTRTFVQTLNPWNRDATGMPKTPAQIRAELVATAADWAPDFTHAVCAAMLAADGAERTET